MTHSPTLRLSTVPRAGARATVIELGVISHLSRQEGLGIPRPLDEDPEDLVVRRHQERVVADGVEDLDRDLVGVEHGERRPVDRPDLPEDLDLLGDVRLDRPRTEAGHPHAARPRVDRQRLGERDDRRLARGVGDAVRRVAPEAGGRRRVDDVTPPPFHHARQEGVDAPRHGKDVHVQRPFPCRQRYVLGSAEHQDPDVVHHDVHRPERVHRRLVQREHVVVGGDVTAACDGPASGSGDLVAR